MKFKYIHIVFFSLTFLSLSSCKKFVQIPPPITTLVTPSVFADNTAATSAQFTVYTQMNSTPFNINYKTGLSSDELYRYATSQSDKNLYANSLNAATDGSGLAIWGTVYNFIFEENSVLEGVQNSTGLSAALNKHLIGEAKFTRAYWYFYLVNLYGNIPLATSTDYKINASLGQVSKDAVYQQMVKDLSDAQDSLSATYMDATDTVITAERVRPTKWAATALLARTYLYKEDWVNAEKQASTVIDNNNGLFTILTDLDAVFKKNSLETIWQLQAAPTATNTNEGRNFVLTAVPSTAKTSFTLSPQLLSEFESNDKRRQKWVGTYTSGASSWNYPSKYKAGSTATGTSPEYSMMLRFAELYLIRAEARAKQNNLNGAISDLNVLRTRAGVPLLANGLSQNDVLSAIVHERKVELFTEGHRWLDLKRTNTVDAIMTVVSTQKGGSWDPKQKLYPIPVADITNDANLVQNSGY